MVYIEQAMKIIKELHFFILFSAFFFSENIEYWTSIN